MNRIHFRSRVVAVFLWLVPAAPAFAGFTNGGFEANSFAGWTLEYGTYQGNAVISGWSTSRPTGFPVPTIVTATTPSQTGQKITITPYNSDHMALINDVDGGQHATRISQSGVLTSADVAGGSFLTVNWGAVLCDPGHPAGQEPFFQILLLANSTPIGSFTADASTASSKNSGWTNAGKVSDGSKLWYRHGTFCVDVGSRVGDNLTIQMTVADCSQGGHGGYAYIDGVGIGLCDSSNTPLCSNPCAATTGSMAVDFIPDAFTPNNDGKNDVWCVAGIENVSQLEVMIFNRWDTTGGPPWVFSGSPLYDRKFLPAHDHGVVCAWDGKYLGKVVQEDTYVYKLIATNCDQDNSQLIIIGKVTVVR